jgi:hypothetical protein
MADGDWKNVDRRGKSNRFDEDSWKKQEKSLRDEGKLIIFRLEKIIKHEDTLNLAAVTEAIKSTINNSSSTTLLSLDGQNEIHSLNKFTSKEQAEKFFKVTKTEQTQVHKFTVLFKVKTEEESFSQIKNNAFNTITEGKWMMRKHLLSPDQTDIRLAFNIFLVNPYLVNREEQGNMMDDTIKDYAKNMIDSDPKAANKFGSAFCKWIKQTKERTIEIGIRKFSADYEDSKNETIEVNSMVLTVNVEGRFLPQLKDLIKMIKWDENIFGVFIEENPSKRNENIMMMYKHNNLCTKSAYVKITWMPEKLLAVKIPRLAPTGFTNALLKKKVKDANEKTVNLFRSINKIREKSGMYFLITTKELLETAQETVTEMMEKINKSTLRRNDESFPDELEVVVTVKSSSKAGSEISEFSKANKVPKIDENDPDVAMGVRSMARYASKMNNRNKGPPKNINYMNEFAFSATSSGEKNRKKVKSYAEIATFNQTTETKTDTDHDMNVDDDGSYNEDGSNNSGLSDCTSKFDQLDNEDVRIRTTMDSHNALVAELKTAQQEAEKIKKEKDEMEKTFKQFMTNCTGKMDELAAENKTLRLQFQQFTNSMNTNSVQLMESPMPQQKSKRSKNLVSGTKRATMSSNVTSQRTAPSSNSLEIMDTEINEEEINSPEPSPSKILKASEEIEIDDYSGEEDEKADLLQAFNNEDETMLTNKDEDDYHYAQEEQIEDAIDEFFSTSDLETDEVEDKKPAAKQKPSTTAKQKSNTTSNLKEAPIPAGRVTKESSLSKSTLLSPELKRMIVQTPNELMDKPGKKSNAKKSLTFNTDQPMHPVVKKKTAGKYV